MNLKTFFIILACTVLSCKNSDKSKKADYEKTKEELAEKEKQNALDFLTISGSDKRNLLGKTVIDGTVQNTATVSSYKDVRIKMLFFKQSVQVANHEQVLDETLEPGEKHEFKSRYKTPKGTDSVALSVMSAEIISEN